VFLKHHIMIGFPSPLNNDSIKTTHLIG